MPADPLHSCMHFAPSHTSIQNLLFQESTREMFSGSVVIFIQGSLSLEAIIESAVNGETRGHTQWTEAVSEAAVS